MFSNIRDELIGAVVDKVSEKLDEITNGQVQLNPSGLLKLDGNSYVDKVLSKLNTKLEDGKLDRMGLPSQSFDFEKAVACGIVLPGIANLTEGLLSGLSTFCRMEDTRLEFDIMGDPILYAGAAIGIKRTALEYAVNLGMFCFSKDASIAGILSDVHVVLGLKVGRDLKVVLDKFDFKYDSKLDLDFKNFEPFDDVIDSVISQELQTSVKESLSAHLTKHVKSMIGELVQELGIQESIKAGFSK